MLGAWGCCQSLVSHRAELAELRAGLQLDLPGISQLAGGDGPGEQSRSTGTATQANPSVATSSTIPAALPPLQDAQLFGAEAIRVFTTPKSWDVQLSAAPNIVDILQEPPLPPAPWLQLYLTLQITGSCLSVGDVWEF